MKNLERSNDVETKIINTKSENKIIFICWLVYTAAYIGRLNFSASLVAIIDSLGTTKAEAGLVGSFFFFAYGAGQLINGILSKKYNAKIMIFISMMISAVLNFALPISNDINIMKYIWLLNGIVQSVLWCTLIKTLSEKISDKNMPKAIVMMSTTVPVGTFLTYGFSALFVKLGIWQGVFYLASAVLAISGFVWFAMYGKSENKTAVIEDVNKKQTSKIGKFILLSLILTAIAGIANGFVKDGINTWVSSVLYEEFKVSQSFSIMLTLLLPLVATLAATVVKKIHEKISSHTVMNMMFFTVSAILCAGILPALKMHSFVTIMACFMGIAFLMAMVNNVITSIFALDYRNVLNAGFAAGFLNTFCYIGSTITSYSLGAVSQKNGWNAVFIIMLIVCAVAAVVSSVGLILEKKRRDKNV